MIIPLMGLYTKFALNETRKGHKMADKVDLKKVEEALSRALTDQYRQFGLEIKARLVPKEDKEEKNEVASA